MGLKILVTPRSFGKKDPFVFRMLEKAGLTVVRNETGNILDKESMKSLLKDCDGVIVGVDPLDAEVITTAPRLKAIAKYGVGLDNIDIEAAKSRSIKVSCTTGANSEAVADYTMALMLAVARKVVEIDKKCRTGNWVKIVTSDISNKTLGLIGLGVVGKLVAARAQGFSMKVIAHDIFWDAAYAEAHNITKATPEEIYESADIISVHLPLTPETNNYIGQAQINKMKPTVIIVNTARGGIINEDALFNALANKRIYGAGIDTFTSEPPKDARWFKLDNIVLGSHCAASTEGAIRNMGRMAAMNLLKDLGIEI
ncbi:MAG TPA: phosphoglycerate dehydrogenase [Clostridia bacterium]